MTMGMNGLNRPVASNRGMQGTQPVGGSAQEPIQNWYAYDVALRNRPAADPPARDRDSLFGPNKSPNQMQGIPPMGGVQPTIGGSPYPRIQTDGSYPRPGMQGTQPVGGNVPEGGYPNMQARRFMNPYAQGQTNTPPHVQPGGGAMPNPTGFNSGQFQSLNVRQNPYAQQSNYYGQMAFNPQMYGGGAGYGFGGQFQGMNPYQSMQQLQQWRNPYVNNMIAGGALQQPQRFQMYNRPQMPQMPGIPQMPQFPQWNPYGQPGYGTPTPQNR